MAKNIYKELLIWQKSIELIKDVYKIAEALPKSEEFNLKQQLKRSVVSVALNIAEGKNRQTSKDFAHFLTMSVASLAEVEAILSICKELNFLKDVDSIGNDIETLGKMINSFKTKLLAKGT